MKAEWRQVIQEFYEEKNRAWLSGDGSTITQLSNHSEAIRSSIEDINAFQRSAKERGIRLKKSRTNIKWTHASWTPRGKAKIDLLEQVTWIYHDGEEMRHQARVQPVRMILGHSEGRWKIEKLDRTGEKDDRYLLKAPIEFRSQDITTGMYRYQYDRRKAQRYAELWWNSFNPQYKKMDVDCTNFISQALHAGGLPMEFNSRRDQGWWYRKGSWSYSWTVAHALRWYLEASGRAKAVASPQDLMIGDVICYDWDGNGKWEHNTIIVGFDRNGMPLVNAHTVASQHRYWDYKDSYAWTENTRYRFFHILDSH